MHCDTLKQDNDSTVRGDGEVGSARYEPALLPPCPSIRVLSYSNCQEIHSPADGPGSVSVNAGTIVEHSKETGELILSSPQEKKSLQN